MCYNMTVKPLHKKKAVLLYETRMRVGFVVMTVVFYLLAAIIWYMLAAVLPYTQTVNVSESENVFITREALSASQEQINRSERLKERVLLMPTSESTFNRRLKLIADAKETVDFMVFDTYAGDFTDIFYGALINAADRGIKVRVVLDGKMGKLGGSLKPIENLLSNHNNIELYYFNGPNVFDPGGLMTLMHDKLTVVDGDKCIVGGVNMGTGAYLSNFDMEVMVTNSGANGAAGQVKHYYETMLKSGLVKRFTSKIDDIEAKKLYIGKYTEYFAKSEFANATIDYASQGVAVDKITLVNNRISARKKSPIIWQALYNLMYDAKKSILVTPYTLLQNDKKDQIKSLAARNDEFVLITNSLYNTRNVGYADYYYTRKAYLTDDIKLLEYQAENQLHAKMFAIDDRYSIIGSFNLDERSIHIDTESVLVIDSPAFNKILTDYITDTMVNNSLEVGKDNEYILTENIPSAPTVDAAKRFKYAIYRVLGVVRCLI